MELYGILIYSCKKKFEAHGVTTEYDIGKISQTSLDLMLVTISREKKIEFFSAVWLMWRTYGSDLGCRF